MKRSSSTTANQRKEILAELNDITTMERGTLAEEYRERPALGGQGTVRLCPYFKHQCWEDGHSVGRVGGLSSGMGSPVPTRNRTSCYAGIFGAPSDRLK